MLNRRLLLRASLAPARVLAHAAFSLSIALFVSLLHAAAVGLGIFAVVGLVLCAFYGLVLRQPGFQASTILIMIASAATAAVLLMRLANRLRSNGS